MLSESQIEKEMSTLPQQVVEKHDLVTYAPVKQGTLHFVLKAALLALECICLSCAGAIMAQYYQESGDWYLYFVEIPWTVCCFEVLAFATAQKLLKEELSLKRFSLHAVVRAALAGIFSSAAIFGLREAFGEFRIFTLFLVLAVDVCLANIPAKGGLSRKHLLAALPMLILLSQLYYSFIYGGVITNLPYDEIYTVWICFSYPLVIGLFKAAVQALDEAYFDCGDLLEVISFGIADLPYRFLYFSLDEWKTAFMLLSIKYTYKIYGYWVTIFLRKIIAFFSLKVRRKKRTAPGKQFFVVPGNSKVFEESEFLQEMAMKFFMQEMIDSFDLIAVLIILAATRGAGFGLGDSFSQSAYVKISEQILVELGLELIFASVTLLLVKAKWPEFQPWTRGARFLKEHKSHILLLVASAYPLIFLLVSVFQGDIAVLILEQVN